MSAILAVLPQLDAEHLTFVGGTALARTHLDGLRVSEDIDLLVADPTLVAEQFTEQLPRLLRKDYPELAVRPPFTVPRSLNLQVHAPDVAAVQIQVIRTERAEAALEYESRHMWRRLRVSTPTPRSTAALARNARVLPLGTAAGPDAQVTEVNIAVR